MPIMMWLKARKNAVDFDNLLLLLIFSEYTTNTGITVRIGRLKTPFPCV